jgi:simple sugar transport system substrate-binding protein/ribose transport system substrate-binding protein
MKKTMIFVLSVIVLCMVFCSCSKKNDVKTSKPKIAGIVFQEDQFFRLILFGMRDAAEKGGAEFFAANSLNKPDKEMQLVNTYIARKVDAIVISPLSRKASQAAIKRANDKGITIITYNSTIDADFPASYIESDQFDLGAQTGRAARKYIEENLGGKAKIAILAFKSQVPEQSNQRSDGFKSEVTKLPGVRIVAEQDAWLAEMAVKKCGDILTANPDVNIIWAANEGGTVGSVMAVKNAGKAGRVAVFGTDTSEQLISFLLSEDNILQAITGQRPYEIGSMAVEYALKALRDEPIEKKVSMPGILLRRDDPQGVKAFEKKLKELIDKG